MDHERMLKAVEFASEESAQMREEDEITLIKMYGNRLLSEFQFSNTQDDEEWYLENSRKKRTNQKKSAKINHQTEQITYLGESSIDNKFKESQSQQNENSREIKQDGSRKFKQYPKKPYDLTREIKRKQYQKNRGPFVANAPFIKARFNTTMTNVINSQVIKKKIISDLSHSRQRIQQQRKKVNNKYANNPELLTGFQNRLQKDLQKRKERELNRGLERLQKMDPDNFLRVQEFRSKSKSKSKYKSQGRNLSKQQIKRNKREKQLYQLRKVKKLEEQKKVLTNHLKISIHEVPREQLMNKMTKIIRINGSEIKDAYNQ